MEIKFNSYMHMRISDFHPVFYLDSCMREMKAREGELGPRLRGTEESLVASLFAVLLAKNERKVQRILDE